ncbi:hypothetical protein CDEST_06174 [Colletotrichum destructivum]|uniref:Uncharacterized protein n=1 Tax=Colletotrichum destructivum TaxID=34406 RepID=A0AAX4ICP3_9PEZI|nr:hypothetical protein CDEST_06174 [Colletotrichum destructivum]
MKFMTFLTLFAVSAQAAKKWCECDNGGRASLPEDTAAACKILKGGYQDGWCYLTVSVSKWEQTCASGSGDCKKRCKNSGKMKKCY